MDRTSIDEAAAAHERLRLAAAWLRRLIEIESDKRLGRVVPHDEAIAQIEAVLR